MTDSIIDQAVDAIEMALQFEYEGYQYPAAKRAAQALADANLLRPEIDDAMVERALWAWVASAAAGVTRENVDPRVLDLNRHRARAALEAALGGEQ